MPDATTTASTFVLRRLADPVPLDLSGTPAAQAVVAAAVGVLGLAFVAWRFARMRPAVGRGVAGLVALLRAAAVGGLVFAVACPALVIDDWGSAAWLAVTAAGVGFALSTVYALYADDRRTAGWRAVPLAALRTGVFLLLAWAFLLPAEQSWDEVERNSKVVVVLDVSPSVTQVSDDPAASAARPGKTRLDAVIDFLTDPQAGFLGKLLEKNPVTVYRFGGRLDEDAEVLSADRPGLGSDEWKAFATYDFKPWVVRNLSPAGREAVVKSAAWGDEPGSAEWATQWAKRPAAETTPGGLAEADAEALKESRARLEKRVDVARAVAGGTAVPDALAAVVSREAGNLVQGVVVFTDGRSTLASEAGVRALKDRAAREKVPVFTVAVGEPRDAVRIALSDVQAPDVVPPGEEFKVVVEGEGVGLAGATVPVTLGVYPPGRDPKAGPPEFELPAADMTFQGDSVPPRGQAEFGLDPARLPDALTEPVPAGVPGAGAGKRRLKQGAWQVVARAARDKREVGGDPVHVSPPRRIEVLDRPTRILLFAGGPTREYQTLRTLLVRETSQKRAELSIYLQTLAGRDGSAVQDVPAERLLNRFPTRYDVRNVPAKAGERFDNLNEFDLVIAFDPDWSELSAEQTQNLQTWVDQGGGGVILVAGPLNTFQLARADADGRLKPVLDLLPVVPDDIILVKTRPIPRTPRRLTLRPSAEYDVLRLDDEPAADPVAGWEPFFTGNESLAPGTPPRDLAAPKRGFYSYYPVKETKRGASTLADFLDVSDRGEPEPRPWLVTAQTGAGRTVFVGAGETWLFRAFDQDFFDRFWVKLTRYTAGGRTTTGTVRGRVLVAKEAASGSQLRVQVKLLGPNGRPYPAEAAPPKFRVEQFSTANDKEKEHGPYELRPRVSGAGFDGYYAGQVTVDPAKFPPGDRRYRVVVDVPDSPGDTLTGDFQLRKSDPELDQTRPDFAALEELAGTVDEVRARIKDPAVLDALRAGGDPAAAKLAFRLGDRARLALIPACLDATTATSSNRGPVRDLWDGPAYLTLFGSPVTLVAFEVNGARIEVGWLLAAVVLLLGLEWLARKLLRLA